MGTHLRKHVARRAYGARTSVRTHHRRRADRFTNLIYTSTHPPTHPPFHTTEHNRSASSPLSARATRSWRRRGASCRRRPLVRWVVCLRLGFECRWTVVLVVGLRRCVGLHVSDRASRVDGMSHRACSMVSSAKARVVRPPDLTSTYHHRPRRQDPDPARRVDAGQAVQALLQQAPTRHRVEARVQSAD